MYTKEFSITGSFVFLLALFLTMPTHASVQGAKPTARIIVTVTKNPPNPGIQLPSSGRDRIDSAERVLPDTEDFEAGRAIEVAPAYGTDTEIFGGTRTVEILPEYDTGTNTEWLVSAVQHAQKQRHVSNSVMAAMSGVRFHFAPEDPFSVSVSGGTFTGNYSVGGGAAWRPNNTFVLSSSGAVHFRTKQYALNVGMSLSF